MAERIFVGVAWPYANYLLHAGQAAGAYLPADIFARYHRMAGNDVLMVSGSDCHGTPITVAAGDEGIAPRDVIDRYHPKMLECWERFGISFDLYTTTLTENHRETVQAIFTRLLERGHLYRGAQDQLYDPEAGRFLPDRYVEGTCPRCAAADARGDQCDQCGSQLDAIDLIEPRSRLSGAAPEVRRSEHFLLRLSAFGDELAAWVRKQAHWRRNVANFTLGVLDEGLKDRAITRDIDWGVPVPVPGYEDKRIYVWFDAVIGYLSASREWAAREGDPEAWRAWWEDGDARAFYFIGKDNIVFHTLIWPAMLLGHGGLNLPHDVPANQYVTFAAGQKQSKSKGTATWLLDLLDAYDADVVRFYLTRIMPETADAEFREDELIRANNEVLIATWGNLVNRVLAMIRREFGGAAPDPGAPGAESAALLDAVRAGFDRCGAEYAACRFRGALREALSLAQQANRYLDARAPWKAAREDRAHAAETLHTALQAISGLCALLHPVLPFSTARLHAILGHEGDPRTAGWRLLEVPAGRPLGEGGALYRKIDLPETATA